MNGLIGLGFKVSFTGGGVGLPFQVRVQPVGMEEEGRIGAR